MDYDGGAGYFSGIDTITYSCLGTADQAFQLTLP
jgi:hypothetical protein